VDRLGSGWTNTPVSNDVRRDTADVFHESHDRFEIALGRPNESERLLQLFGVLTVVIHRDGTVAIELDVPAIECRRIVEGSL